MQLDKPILQVNTFEALLVISVLLGGISTSIIWFEMVPHIPIVLAIMGLMLYGVAKRVKVAELEAGMIDGTKKGIGAILIFFFIGMLISAWMASGTIPTFVYLALELVNGKFYYALVFLVSAIIGISIGSSLTTAGTIGVVFISVSNLLGISPAITAGAVISGAFFGDKMSPLSDTTNLASMIVDVDLFVHIRNMAWTTIPAFVISLVLFAYFSPGEAAADFEKMKVMKSALTNMNLVHWYSLLPFLLLAVLAFKKTPAFLTLTAGIISALVLAVYIQSNIQFQDLFNILFSGYKSESGIEEVDSLLTRGGIESMMFAVSLVLLALSMGGLLIRLGILPSLLAAGQRYLSNSAALINSAAFTAIGINFMLGEQYLSILLTGNTFKEVFMKAGLHPKNLSRVLEDAGTVVNPLVPWGVSGVFLANVLGVSTIEYLPFTFFCLASPIITMLFGITGITITKIQQKPATA